MLELFKEYIAEKDGAELIEVSGAFLTFIIAGEQFYISDFHIAAEKRSNGKVFFRLMEKALEIAEQRQCKRFTCHVPLNIKDLSAVVKLRLKFGFVLLGTDESQRLAFEMPTEKVKQWAKQ